MNDLKFAIRQLFKNPDFTAVALLSLALGIGINATIFSILDTFLFRDLPFKDPDGLVVLWEVNSKQQGRRRPPTFATFDEWRAQSQSLERLGLFDGYGGSITLAGSGQATRVRSQAVDVNFFPVLGIQPALGRWFLPGDLDDRVNHDEARPIVISHQTWRHRLGGIKEVTGQMLTVDGVARPVVGVMPAARSIGGQDISDWIPRIEKVRLAYFGDAAPVFYFLHATVGLVLLIACANVANLLLAQGMVRQKELAIRASAGVTRWRLIRQVLTESLVLSISGGALGVLMACLFPARAATKVDPLVALRQESTWENGKWKKKRHPAESGAACFPLAKGPLSILHSRFSVLLRRLWDGRQPGVRSPGFSRSGPPKGGTTNVSRVVNVAVLSV